MNEQQDWVGNKKSVFVTLGATNHSVLDRAEQDYYATNPKAIDALFAVESFDGCIWEPACGGGHLSKRMEELGSEVLSTDLYDRGYGTPGINFLAISQPRHQTHIVTNPPYKYGKAFVEKALELIDPGYKVAMFLKLTFLEGQERRKMFQTYPPKTVWVFSRRMSVARNGDPEMFTVSSAAAYAWFVWEKGFVGHPSIGWI